tara:strand:- start:731 stop:1249 length:519 start_codon:yes stop_codon:yes gene_type:complete
MKNTVLLLLSFFTVITFAQTTHEVYGGMANGTFYFTPQNLTINQGDIVNWYNDGGLHDVNGVTNSTNGVPFNNPESFASAPTNVTDALIYTHTFNIPGFYNYDCSIGAHASNGMTGTINVLPNNSAISEAKSSKKIINTFNILGEKIDMKTNTKMMIHLYDDNSVTKEYIIK